MTTEELKTNMFNMSLEFQEKFSVLADIFGSSTTQDRSTTDPELDQTEESHFERPTLDFGCNTLLVHGSQHVCEPCS